MSKICTNIQCIIANYGICAMSLFKALSHIIKRMIFTLLITSYECKDMGKTFLEESMNAILEQTYRPLQVVISDHSINICNNFVIPS